MQQNPLEIPKNNAQRLIFSKKKQSTFAKSKSQQPRGFFDIFPNSIKKNAKNLVFCQKRHNYFEIYSYRSCLYSPKSLIIEGL